MPGYLLVAKPFPGPMMIYPLGFILDCAHKEHELDPNLCAFIKHYDMSKPVCGHWNDSLQRERKQTSCTMNSQMQYVWRAWRSGFATSGHRVALVVHRAQKTVPDSAGEWPTFSPPPLESCSGATLFELTTKKILTPHSTGQRTINMGRMPPSWHHNISTLYQHEHQSRLVIEAQLNDIFVFEYLCMI